MEKAERVTTRSKADIKADTEQRLSYIFKDPTLKKELFDSNDRTCAIIGASVLEFKLERLLRSLLIDFPRCLNTFSAKIEMCYSLGFFDQGVYHDLDIIKQIRNDFAHNIYDCSFNKPEIIGLIDSLKYHQGGKVFFKQDDKKSLFIILITILDGVLTWISEDIKQVKPLEKGNYEVILDFFQKSVNKKK